MPHWPGWPHHYISLVGQISLVSISSLIGHNYLVGFTSLFGHIGLVGRIGHNGLFGVIGVSLFILVGLSIHWPFKLATHQVAIKLTCITEISKVIIMQAAHRVVTVSSTTKITNAAICYYCPASLYYTHLCVRESWLWLS
jgi:hypothetical protein